LFSVLFIFAVVGGWVGGCGGGSVGVRLGGGGWEGVWVAGGGAGGWYGMGCCYFRPHLQEHSEEERLKKENQEKKEKRKTSPGDPGFPGVDPESPVSLGSQNPKESLLGTRGIPREYPVSKGHPRDDAFENSGENPRTFKSLLAWTPPPFRYLFAMGVPFQCTAEWGNGQQQRHEG